MTKGRESKFSRLIRAPIRALGKARDFYVSSMTGCAGKISYASVAMACPMAIPPSSYSFHQNSMSRSSSCSREDDLKELIRAASELKSPITRSQSVVVGRIDEDSPCEFEGEVRVGSNLLFPRSISCAAARRPRTSTRLAVFA